MYRRNRIAACATALGATLLASSCSDSADAPAPAVTTPAATAAVLTDTLPVAPYIDIVSGTVDIGEAAAASGQTDFTLAFVLADPTGACVATWGGHLPLDASAVQTELAEIRSLGGEVIVSTGGALGTYLESVCTAEELTAAYTAVLDATGTNHLDVDIEQSITPGTVTTALAALQARRGTAVTLTVPVDGTEVGLPEASVALLRSARDAGVEVSVNAMTMNFDADGDWGAGMAAATRAVHDDLATVWTDRTAAELWSMLGVTPMIGVNDTGPVTTVENATTLLDFAQETGLGFVRFWSVNRDNGACPTGALSPTCSGIAQPEYAFSTLFTGFGG